jgi:outer membrane protein assembly factor BamB
VRLVTLALLATTLALAPAGLAQAWTMENADAPNGGRLDVATPAGLDGARTTDLGTDSIVQVVEGPAGLALVAGLDGTVHAVDAAGETVWTADVADELRTAALWTGEHVLVVPRSDEAVALTPEGEVAWTLPIGNERPSATVVRMASPALHPTGDAVVATLAGQVHRVTPDGEVAWTHEVGGDRSVQATPAVLPGGDVIVASFVPGEEDAGVLERLDGATGDPEWGREIGAQVVGAPAAVDDRVLVPLRDQTAVEARSLDDGTRLWNVGFDDRVTMSPAVHEGTAVAGDVRGVLRGIDVASGDVEWTFNPLEDDPDQSALAGTECTVLTIADSPAIDGEGVAWTPYWNANICEGFPPRESGPSPVYRIDAASGERLDRNRYDEANHGTALHATGVWAGTDEGGVRTWPRTGTLQAEAFADGAEVTLVTNTDRTGSWSLDWGTDEQAGEGSPPVLTAGTLPLGEHTITVTVDGATTTTEVTVAQQADPADDGSGDDGLAPIDAEDATPSGGQDVPAPGLAALLAAVGAAFAGRPRRG